MVYYSNSIGSRNTAVPTAGYVSPAGGLKAGCGCGSASGLQSYTLQSQAPVREGFQAAAAAPAATAAPVAAQLSAGGGAPMCTLTATAPPAGCCHPAPLHCDCCNGSGYFRASEAYGQ